MNGPKESATMGAFKNVSLVAKPPETEEKHGGPHELSILSSRYGPANSSPYALNVFII